MSSNKAASFSSYCCRLVRADETQAEYPSTYQPYGTIVKLSGLPLNDELRNQLIPGLSLRVRNVSTEYVLVTTHSLIPKSSYLNLWKFSEEFLGPHVAKKTLGKYVSGMVSCCGEESGFIIPGPTTAREHGGKKCNLGLNFTVLFLNEKFKEQYCTHYGSQPNPPCVDINQCRADINLVCKYFSLYLPQTQECELVQATLTEVASSTNSSGSFEVISGVSPNGRVSMSAVGLSVIDVAESPRGNSSDESSAHRSNMKLAQDIVTFQRVKSVQCKGSSHLCEGMPLVYMSTDGQEFSKLIGVLTGDGQALILGSLFHLLQGNPAASLSLLVYTEMWRLWTYKWSHLLLPYLENHPAQPTLILEILTILLERKDEEHFLSVSRRDDLNTQLGFLKFLKVLFHHFGGQSKEVITQMTGEVCTQAGVPVDNFLSDIGGLCESLLSIAKYCCDYQDMEDPKIVSLAEHCFICANEMLNFQHDKDVVEKVLCTEKFETTLTSLQNSCPQSSIIPSNLVAFYRKLHTPCRRILERGMQELCCCKDELTSCKQKEEKLQAELCELKKEHDETTKKCHTLKTQYSAASEKCQKAMSMLKDSEKRQREIERKNKELNAEVEELQRQLMSERESKQKLEEHTVKLSEDTRRLEDDKKKLAEEKGKLQEDKAKLEKDNERLKAENEALEFRAKQLTQSGHEIHRTVSDLTSKMHQFEE